MKNSKDYGFIRGFCYGWEKDPQRWEIELGYAQRLNLNSARIWLRYPHYFEDPDAFVSKLRSFIRSAFSKGITVMPILFNGNMIDFTIVEDSWWEIGDKYAKHIVDSIKDEEGLIMWDIMNEPTCNDYILWAKDKETADKNSIKMWRFLEHYCDLVKLLDSITPITIGHTLANELQPTADYVDVLSFHEYSDTTAKIIKNYDIAQDVSKTTGKPVINSELCCLCRGNPYDVALKICQERELGWYLFELMIDGYWGEVHGLFYPDGTIRDPASIAAVMGFFRNLNPKTRVKARANKEGNVEKALALVNEALKDDTSIFSHKDNDLENVLDAAERCIMYLEGCELVSMHEPPSVQLRRYREQENPNLEEVRAWTYDLAMKLKKLCHIL